MLIRSILMDIRKIFPDISLRTESETLLLHIIKKNRVYLHTHPEYHLTDLEYKNWQDLFTRYQAGEPLAYLMQQQSFYGLDLYVTPDVLIPRSETELLVDTILMKLPQEKINTVLDLGTGSGAIAIALAKNRPHWKILATDDSDTALTIAKKNASNYQLNNISFLQSNWFNEIPAEKFNLIVSNPPYIDFHDPAVAVNVKTYEPHSALFAEDDGLADIKNLIISAKNHLKSDGYFLLEHGYQQQELIIDLLEKNNFRIVERGVDLAGWPRYVIAQ